MTRSKTYNEKNFFLIINSALLYCKKEDYNIKIRET